MRLWYRYEDALAGLQESQSTENRTLEENIYLGPV